ETKRIVLNCTQKRELLLQSAISKSKSKKGLTITSGILALFSAGAITSVIVKYFGNDFLQIIAAITAALSGILSLILSIYFSEENTSKIFEGASKYLTLRDKTYRLLLKPNNTNEKFYEELSILQSEYAQLDEPYSKYVHYKKTFRFLFLVDRKSSHMPGFLKKLNADKIRIQEKLDNARDSEWNTLSHLESHLTKNDG
ncbi:MAG: hypothetical protein ABR503_14905, partial [Chitinophagaceae bacterium]